MRWEPSGESPIQPTFTGSGTIFGPGFREVPPPQIFKVGFSSDKTMLIFTVGDPPITNRRRTKSSYRIYFAPIDLASPHRISSPFVAYEVFRQSVQIGSGDAPQNGGLITITDTTHAGLDGWFFATAINLLGVESAYNGPVRNPIVGTNDSRVAPDVHSPSALLFDGGLDPWGRQLIKARISARVPAQSQGVSTVTMENPGQDYTHNFPVIFTNATGDTTGHGAYGVANIQDGRVLGVTITQAGSDYTIAPIVQFTNGDGIGAAARAELTQTGSFSGMQMYLFNYFESGEMQEGPTISAPTFGGKATKPGDLVHGDLLFYPDAPPSHIMRLHFVSLSQTATRRIDPQNAPYVEFATGLRL